MNFNFNARKFLAGTLALVMVMSMTSAAVFAQNFPNGDGVGNIATPQQAVEICGDIDLVFVVDDTGSMFTAIGNVKANLPAIMAAADSKDDDGQARVGLITFKDSVSVIQDLTASRAAVVASIAGLAASGGGPLPEASNEAKNTAINNLGPGPRNDIDGNPGVQVGDFSPVWAGDQNIIILITDDDAGGFDDNSSPNDKQQMADLGTAAAAHIPPIQVGDVNVAFAEIPSTMDPMVADATNSGGIYGFTSIGVDTADVIIDIIVGIPCPEVVGGEFLPIDTTALLVAGAQTNAVWIMSALAVIGSVAFGALYLRTKRN